MSAVTVIAMPRIDPAKGRIVRVVPQGATVAEMVALTLPEWPPETWRWLHVEIGGREISHGIWHLVRPRDGMAVTVRSTPSGSNARTILTIVVAVAAIALGQFYVGPALAAAGYSTAAVNFGVAASTLATPCQGGLAADLL